MARMPKRPAAERLKLLRNAEGAPGQFPWAILRNSFHPPPSNADDRRVSPRRDQAMRWLRRQLRGPFELWHMAGWPEVAKDGRKTSTPADAAAPLPNAQQSLASAAGGVRAGRPRESGIEKNS